jgi:polysaccharide export outer membrane protein
LEPTETTANRDFVVIPLDASVVDALGFPAPVSISAKFRDPAGMASAKKSGVGNQLEISIWEPSPDGLFSTAEQKVTRMKVSVDKDGNIFMPYVGQISVAGLSTEEIRQAIATGLKGRAVDPQVQVFLENDLSRKLSVIGDVGRQALLDVPLRGLRLIEALALVGGPTYSAFETEITIVRGNISSTVRLDNIIASERNNIWLQPEDTVQVKHRPRRFTAFGAVSSQSLQPFKTESVSLIEALAQTGGLNDNLADAGGVFLFRFETAARLRGSPINLFGKDYGQRVPTIYRLDFRQPQAFF